MNVARHQEFLGRLLDGRLSETDARDWAADLSANEELRRDLRTHLVIWELWSQHQAPERSPEAFLNALKTRIRVEAESSDAFSRAVRTSLAAQSRFSTWAARSRAFLLSLRGRRRTGLAWAASTAFAALALVVWLVTSRPAQAVTILEGEAVCTACVLHESHEHAPAVRVTVDGVTQVYYLDRNQTVAALQDYFCSGPAPIIAEGKAGAAKGRRTFEASTITIPESDTPETNSTNTLKRLFPI